jgi:hypothetical protein
MYYPKLERFAITQENGNLKNCNKRWHKLNNNEVSILKNLVVNNFWEKLHFKDARNVVKKEIWKHAINDVKKIRKWDAGEKCQTDTILL